MQKEKELHVKAPVDIPPDKLSEIKAETLAYTLGHVYCTHWRTRVCNCRPKVLPTYEHATRSRAQDTRKHTGR